MIEDKSGVVANGARFLDEQIPGWVERIDPSILDMANRCKCIFGQLYGEYFTGCYRLNLTPVAACDMGFDTLGDQGGLPTQEAYSALGSAWREQIAERCT